MYGSSDKVMVSVKFSQFGTVDSAAQLFCLVDLMRIIQNVYNCKLLLTSRWKNWNELIHFPPKRCSLKINSKKSSSSFIEKGAKLSKSFQITIEIT